MLQAQDAASPHDYLAHRAHQQPYCMQLWSWPRGIHDSEAEENLVSTLHHMPVTDVAHPPLCSATYNTHLQACRQAGAGDVHPLERATKTSVLRCAAPACVLCNTQHMCMPAGKQALEFFSYLGGMELEAMQATRSIAECIVDTTTKVQPGSDGASTSTQTLSSSLAAWVELPWQAQSGPGA